MAENYLDEVVPNFLFRTIFGMTMQLEVEEMGI